MLNQESQSIDDLPKKMGALIDRIRNMDISSTELSRRENLPEVLDEHRSLAQEVGIVLAGIAHSGDTRQHEEALEFVFSELIRSRLPNEYTVGSWIHWYPICYLFNLAGVSAVAGENYKMLAALFHAQIDDDGERTCLLEAIAGYLGRLQAEDVLVMAYRPLGVGRSSHFLKVLRPVLVQADILNDDNYRRFFDRYETFQAAVFCQLAGTKRYEVFLGHFSMRSISHNGTRVNPFFLELIREYDAQGESWPPIKGGLFKHGGGEIGAVLNELSRKRPVA